MKNILIYRLGSLGDTIVALPCLHKIRDEFPDAKRILLTNMPVSKAAPRMEDILRGSGLVDEVITYPIETRSPTAIAALWWRLRQVRADALVYLLTPRGTRALRRDLAFFRACGIGQVIGAPITPDLMFNRIDRNGEEEYECERLARCLGSLGPIDLDDPGFWQLGLSADEMNDAARVLLSLDGHSVVAVNMGTKAPINDWGHANWTTLLTSLAKTFGDLRWVFVGAPSDFDRANDIVTANPGSMLNLCGKLSIRATAAVLSKARLFVGHDSGPLHLAASCDVPCVGLFSTQNKRHKWFPYGKGHSVLYPDGPITSITIDRVFEAVSGNLHSRSSVSPLVYDVTRS